MRLRIVMAKNFTVLRRKINSEKNEQLGVQKGIKQSRNEANMFAISIKRPIKTGNIFDINANLKLSELSAQPNLN